MPKPLTSCGTHGPGLTCSHHAAGARALTSPPCGCCCKRLSRHMACQWLAQCVFSERSTSSPLACTHLSRLTVDSVGSQSSAKGRAG